MPGSGHMLMEVIMNIQSLFENLAESNPDSEELKKLKEDIDKVLELDLDKNDKLYEILVNNEVTIESDMREIMQGVIAAFWIPARKKLQQELENKSKKGNIVADESSNITC